MNSGLPPSTMSVPRPAMLVERVTVFFRPACATMKASRSCCLAFSTSCGNPAFFSSADSRSEFSIEIVPTSTGCPFWCSSLISSTTALYFSRSVRYTMSGYWWRTSGWLVGITDTSSL